MFEAPDGRPYLNINELVAHTGLSTATIWRLKRAGKIPFYQPGGKGTLVKFPVNAIELAGHSHGPRASDSNVETASTKQLSGPRPKWMSPAQQNKYKKQE